MSDTVPPTGVVPPNDAPPPSNDSRPAQAAPSDQPELSAPIRRRTRYWVIGLLAILLISAALCVGIGPVSVAPGTVAKVIGAELGLPITQTWSDSEAAIIWNMRLPRVLLGVGVGAALAICGAALQGMVRNILADPYILGISGGASTGAAAAILFGFAAGAGQYALPTAAFLGALLASLAVFFLARANGQVTSLRLLLAGIAVGYALSACTSFLIFASDDAEGSRTVMFWLLGTLSLARWDLFLWLCLGLALLGVALLCLWGRQLDALSIGDETARALGVSPVSARLKVLTLVSMCTGAAVSAAGAIGFVGLVVPHLARRLVGAAHVRLIPVTALLGAILLIWADAGARVLMAPRELPIGIITALIGAPFLLLLIRRMYARMS